ncbi:MAG: 50S ribosomal protein L29 [Bdellovibrionota bacterium]|nr:MAG: 50S ribosomal protein L29 [Pseudomonadota bacterium]
MDYLKVTAKELRSTGDADLKGAVKEIQKQLATIRMDVYTAPAVGVGKSKKLKKTLARILTVANEKSRKKG